MRRAGDGIEVALITGACSGIGLAMAEQLAALGYTLIVVSNRADAIAQVARDLTARHGVVAHALAVDLAAGSGAERLIEQVEALGVEVHILINNAGIFFFGEAADADPAKARAMLQLHVVTPSLLCSHFARKMRARRRGHIMLVSSISAWKDFPGISYYASSKKYLLGFARSLRSELKVYDVWVTCLAPGATATGLYESTVIDVKDGLKWGVMMRSEQVAEAGLAAMFRKEEVCMPGALTKAMTWAAVMTPGFVIDLVRRKAPWLRPTGGGT